MSPGCKMTSSKRSKVDKVCNICGDIGFAENIVTCHQCKNASEHIYCMQVQVHTFPDIWYCEVCKQNMLAVHEEGWLPVAGSPDKPVAQQLSQNICLGIVENAKHSPSEEVAFLTLQGWTARRWSDLDALHCRIGQANGIPPSLWRIRSNESTHCQIDRANGIPPRPWRIHNNESTHCRIDRVNGTPPSSQRVPSNQSTSHNALKANSQRNEGSVDAEVHFSPMKHATMTEPVRNDQEAKSEEKKTSGNVVCPDASFNKSGFQEMNLTLPLIMSPCDKTPNCYTPGACWKGTFEVFDVVCHSFKIQAHFPHQICSKAYEISKTLPEKLNLKVIPRVDAWPKAFQAAPPTYEDIALYFFPSEIERPKDKYIHLLEHIESHDFAVKTCVDDVDLLVYTSKQLPQASQRIDAEPFLWGVFRHLKRKKQSQDKQGRSPSFISAADTRSSSLGQFNVSSDSYCQEVDDMVGGSKICRTDKPTLIIGGPPPDFSKSITRDVPPGFSKLMSRDASHERRSLARFLPDVPRKFSKTMGFKHGRSSPDATNKDQNLCMKDERDSAPLSSGESHATTLEACEGKTKNYQMLLQHMHCRN